MMFAEVLEATVPENPLLKLVKDHPLTFPNRMTEDEFDLFVLENGELKIEKDKHNQITIHPPMTLDSGFYEGEAFRLFANWAAHNRHLGRAQSISTSFKLPDGSQHKADGAWISQQQLDLLSESERRHIARVVPDFVMEIRSETDRISVLKKKMEEVWMANGVRLAWLIDPLKRMAWVYRLDGSVDEIVGFDHRLFGEEVLPGFELDLRSLT
jgi:Uma2 family endonuclease